MVEDQQTSTMSMSDDEEICIKMTKVSEDVYTCNFNFSQIRLQQALVKLKKLWPELN